MKSRFGKILFMLASFVVVAILMGGYIMFKPARTAKDEAGIPVTAKTLFQAYSADEKKANTLYLDKAVSVTGKISELKTNQEGKEVVVMETDDPVFGIVCVMTEPSGLAAGNEATLKGFCTGYTSDVVLRDCINLTK